MLKVYEKSKRVLCFLIAIFTLVTSVPAEVFATHFAERNLNEVEIEYALYEAPSIEADDLGIVRGASERLAAFVNRAFEALFGIEVEVTADAETYIREDSLASDMEEDSTVVGSEALSEPAVVAGTGRGFFQRTAAWVNVLLEGVGAAAEAEADLAGEEAQQVADEMAIVFHANGGIGGGTVVVSYGFDWAEVQVAEVYAPDGWEFIGWFDTPEAGGNEKPVMGSVTSDSDWFAHWNISEIRQEVETQLPDVTVDTTYASELEILDSNDYSAEEVDACGDSAVDGCDAGEAFETFGDEPAVGGCGGGIVANAGSVERFWENILEGGAQVNFAGGLEVPALDGRIDINVPNFENYMAVALFSVGCDTLQGCADTCGGAGSAGCRGGLERCVRATTTGCGCASVQACQTRCAGVGAPGCATDSGNQRCVRATSGGCNCGTVNDCFVACQGTGSRTCAAETGFQRCVGAVTTGCSCANEAACLEACEGVSSRNCARGACVRFATTGCGVTLNLNAPNPLPATREMRFNANGGTGGGTFMIDVGSAIANTATPTAGVPAVSRVNYNFAGWWTAAVGGSQMVAFELAPAGGTTTWYARWTRQTRQMQFNANGGTGGGTHMIDVGSAIANTATPTAGVPAVARVNYNFAGWWTAAVGGSQMVAFELAPTGGTTTWYARWTRVAHEMEFNANGGTGAGSQTVAVGSTVTNTRTPVAGIEVVPAEGYTFAGWWTTAAGAGVQMEESWVVTEGDIQTTWHARWEPIPTVSGHCDTLQGCADTCAGIGSAECCGGDSFCVRSVTSGCACVDEETCRTNCNGVGSETCAIESDNQSCIRANSGGCGCATPEICVTNCNGIGSVGCAENAGDELPCIGAMTTGCACEPEECLSACGGVSSRNCARGACIRYATTGCCVTLDWDAPNPTVPSHTFGFNPNGGTITGGANAIELEVGTEVRNTVNPVDGVYLTEPLGQSFAGWWTTATGEGTQMPDVWTVPEGGGTLRGWYARWNSYVMLTFHGNGGVFANEQGTYTISVSGDAEWSEIQLPEITRGNLIFNGWFDSDVFGSGIRMPMEGLVADTEITDWHARWARSITFDVGMYGQFEGTDARMYSVAVELGTSYGYIVQNLIPRATSGEYEVENWQYAVFGVPDLRNIELEAVVTEDSPSVLFAKFGNEAMPAIRFFLAPLPENIAEAWQPQGQKVRQGVVGRPYTSILDTMFPPERLQHRMDGWELTMDMHELISPAVWLDPNSLIGDSWMRTFQVIWAPVATIGLDPNGTVVVDAPPVINYSISEGDRNIVITVEGMEADDVVIDLPDTWRYEVVGDGNGNAIITLIPPLVCCGDGDFCANCESGCDCETAGVCGESGCTPPNYNIEVGVGEDGSVTVETEGGVDYEVSWREEDGEYELTITFPGGHDVSEDDFDLPPGWEIEIVEEDDLINVIISPPPFWTPGEAGDNDFEIIVDEDGNVTVIGPPGQDHGVVNPDDAGNIVITLPPGLSEGEDNGIVIDMPGVDEGWEISIVDDGENTIITITPPWAAQGETITFRGYGGVWDNGMDIRVENTPQNGTYEAVMARARVGLTRAPYGEDGWQFDGWWTLPVGGSEVMNNKIVTETSPRELWARWAWNGLGEGPDPEQQIVTFYGNGGTWFTGAPTETSVRTQVVVRPGNYQLAFALVGQPQNMPGWEFRGWFTDPVGGTEVSGNMPVTEGEFRSLHAQWTWNDSYGPKQRTQLVIFRGMGGGPAYQSRVMVEGETYGDVLDRITTPARQGHVFLGWFPDPSVGDMDTFVDRTKTMTPYAMRILYARWAPDEAMTLPKQQVVIFRGNAGAPAYQAVTVTIAGSTYGDAFALVEEPTRAGWTFNGWHIDHQRASVIAGSRAVLDRPFMTVFAQWTPNAQVRAEQVVTFRTLGGSGDYQTATVEIAEDVTYAEVFEQLNDVEKTDHILVGWYTDPNYGSRVDETDRIAGMSRRDLFARWEIDPMAIDPRMTVSVTFRGNGGAPDMRVQPVPVGSTFGDALAALQEGFSRINHTMAEGWFESHDNRGQGPISEDTPITELVSLTVFAHWDLIPGRGPRQTVTFRSEHGADWQSACVPVGGVYAQAFQQIGEPFDWDLEFDGWWTTETEGGVQILDGTPVTSAAHRTLWARWRQPGEETPTRQIILVNDGGTPTVDTFAVPVGTRLDELQTELTNGTRTLLGWSIDTEVDSAILPGATLVPLGDDPWLLFARWSPVDLVTRAFVGNGGEPGFQVRELQVGETYENAMAAADVALPTRDHYTLAGWVVYPSLEAVNVATELVSATEEVRTLMAQWTRIQLEVTFYDDDMTTVLEGPVTVGSGSLLGNVAPIVSARPNGDVIIAWEDRGTGAPLTGTHVIEGAENHAFVAIWGLEGGTVVPANEIRIHFADPARRIAQQHMNVALDLETTFGEAMADAGINTPADADFEGWISAGDGTPIDLGETITESSERLWIANWAAEPEAQVYVTFNAMAGSFDSENSNVRIVAADQGATLESILEELNEVPVRTENGADCAFLGWFTGTGVQIADEFGDILPAGNMLVNADMTLYARWDCDQIVTRTFQVNDGYWLTPGTSGRSVELAVGTDYSVAFGMVGEPRHPSYPDMVFDGWEDSVTGDLVEGTETVANLPEARVLEARWRINEPVEVEIQFINDENTPAMPAILVIPVMTGTDYQEVYNLLVAQLQSEIGNDELTAPGNEFRNWVTTAAERQAISELFGTRVTETSPRTFLARWANESLEIVRIHFEDIEEEIEDQYMDVPLNPATTMGAAMEAAGIVTPTEGWGGWFNARTGGTQIDLTETVTAYSDRRFWARWAEAPEAEYLSFLASPGQFGEGIVFRNIDISQMTTFEEAINALGEEPTRHLHTFLGWYTQANGGGRQVMDADGNVADMPLAGDTRLLFSHWEEPVRELRTFLANGGSWYRIELVAVGEAYEDVFGRVAEPIFEGPYEFDGWFTNANMEEPGVPITGIVEAGNANRFLWARSRPVQEEDPEGQWVVFTADEVAEWPNFSVVVPWTDADYAAAIAAVYANGNPTWQGRIFDGWVNASGVPVAELTALTAAPVEVFRATWRDDPDFVQQVTFQAGVDTGRFTVENPEDAGSPQEVRYIIVGVFENETLADAIERVRGEQFLTLTKTRDGVPQHMTGWWAHPSAQDGGNLANQLGDPTAPPREVWAQWSEAPIGEPIPQYVIFSANGGQFADGRHLLTGTAMLNDPANTTYHPAFVEAFAEFADIDEVPVNGEFVFGGWTFNGTPITANTPVIAGAGALITANAVWIEPVFETRNVTLMADDVPGAEVQTIRVRVGSAAETISAAIARYVADESNTFVWPIEKPGHRLAGWNNLIGNAEIGLDQRLEDVINVVNEHAQLFLRAQFEQEERSYQILILLANGGDFPFAGGNEDEVHLRVFEGETIAEALVRETTAGNYVAPTRAEMSFTGHWMTRAASGSTTVDLNAPVTAVEGRITPAARVLHAEWEEGSIAEPVTQHVMFNAEGGSMPEAQFATAIGWQTYADILARFAEGYDGPMGRLYEPALEGSRFVGWRYRVPGTSDEYVNVYADTRVPNVPNITFHARWEAIEVFMRAVTFHVPGGEPEIRTLFAIIDQPFENVFERAMDGLQVPVGREFGGWVDVNGMIVGAGEILIGADHEVPALASGEEDTGIVLRADLGLDDTSSDSDSPIQTIFFRTHGGSFDNTAVETPWYTDYLGGTENTYAAAFDEAGVPQLSGWAFTGWFEAPQTGDELSDASIPEVIGSETVTQASHRILHAHWEVDDTYPWQRQTVTFDGNGGAPIEQRGTAIIRDGETYAALFAEFEGGELTPKTHADPDLVFNYWAEWTVDGWVRVDATDLVTQAPARTLRAQWKNVGDIVDIETLHINLFANDPSAAFLYNGGDLRDWTHRSEDRLPGRTYGTVFAAAEAILQVPAGYTFAGWFTTPTGGEQVLPTELITIYPGAIRTLFAQWTEEGGATQNLAFLAGDGFWYEDGVRSIDTQRNVSVRFTATYANAFATVGDPVHPEYPRYVFNGWFDNAGNRVTASDTAQESEGENRTLHARFLRDVATRNVVFIGNDGYWDYPADAIGQKEYAAEIGATLASAIAEVGQPSRGEFWEFAGWFTHHTSRIPVGGVAGGTEVIEGGALRLYAGWTPVGEERQVITFHSNAAQFAGVSGNPYDTERLQHVTVARFQAGGAANTYTIAADQLRDFDPTTVPAGTFAGWWTNHGGNGDDWGNQIIDWRGISNIEVTGAEAITLFARWMTEGEVQDQRIIFNANGGRFGSAHSTITIHIEDPIAFDGGTYALAFNRVIAAFDGGVPVHRTHFEFAGWYDHWDRDQGILVAPEDAITTAPARTLYAQWDIDPLNPPVLPMESRTFVAVIGGALRTETVPVGLGGTYGDVFDASPIDQMQICPENRQWLGWFDSETGERVWEGATIQATVLGTRVLEARWSGDSVGDITLPACCTECPETDCGTECDCVIDVCDCYVPDEHRVTFVGQGGAPEHWYTYLTDGTAEATLGEALAQWSAANGGQTEPSNEHNWTFLYWAVNGVEVADWDEAVTGDTVLAAQWDRSRNEFTVSFVGNGADDEFVFWSETVARGTTLAEAHDMWRAYHGVDVPSHPFDDDFGGWHLNTLPVIDWYAPITEDTVLIAMWDTDATRQAFVTFTIFDNQRADGDQILVHSLSVRAGTRFEDIARNRLPAGWVTSIHRDGDQQREIAEWINEDNDQVMDMSLQTTADGTYELFGIWGDWRPRQGFSRLERQLVAATPFAQLGAATPFMQLENAAPFAQLENVVPFAQLRTATPFTLEEARSGGGGNGQLWITLNPNFLGGNERPVRSISRQVQGDMVVGEQIELAIAGNEEIANRLESYNLAWRLQHAVGTINPTDLIGSLPAPDNTINLVAVWTPRPMPCDDCTECPSSDCTNDCCNDCSNTCAIECEGACDGLCEGSCGNACNEACSEADSLCDTCIACDGDCAGDCCSDCNETCAEPGSLCDDCLECGGECQDDCCGGCTAPCGVFPYDDYIVFHANGGTWADTTRQQRAIEVVIRSPHYEAYQAAVNRLGLPFNEVLTRSGYAFDGWFTSQEAADDIAGPYEVYNLGGAIMSDTVRRLYARWMPVEPMVTVAFHVGISDSFEPIGRWRNAENEDDNEFFTREIEVYVGSTYEEALQQLADTLVGPAGYGIRDWVGNLLDEGGNDLGIPIFVDMASEITMTSPRFLTAIWAPAFAVTFHSNGGGVWNTDDAAWRDTGDASTQITTVLQAGGPRFGEAFYQLPELAAREGREFLGWFNIPEYTGGENVREDWGIYHDIILYARWDSVGSDHYVHFHLNNGSNEVIAVPATVGEALVLPQGVLDAMQNVYGIEGVSSGDLFWGWFTDEALAVRAASQPGGLASSPYYGVRRPVIEGSEFVARFEVDVTLEEAMFGGENILHLYAIRAVWGDLNDDGMANMTDVTVAQSLALTGESAVAANLWAGNVRGRVLNAEGLPPVPNMTDRTRIQGYVLDRTAGWLGQPVGSA